MGERKVERRDDGVSFVINIEEVRKNIRAYGRNGERRDVYVNETKRN